MIILGLDPGLGTTGWGLIAADGNRLSHIANGRIRTDSAAPLARRLLVLDAALTDLILARKPDGAPFPARRDAGDKPYKPTKPFKRKDRG